MLTRNKKESKLRQTGLTNFLNRKPITKYLVFVMSFLVLALLIAINSPKQNFIKTLASNFFSGNTPIKEVEITTEDYDNEGSIKVTKEAHWTSRTEAELNLKLETIRKTGDNKKDIVLVFDVSASMEGEKLDKVKEDASELIEYVLDKDEDNKVSIISFASTSRILSPLTNDKNMLLEAVNNMHTEDATNYYLAYKNVETVLDGYSKESGKDLVVLFLTDGVPTINSGATTSIYEALKEEYPYITINAVEYEMGEQTSESVKDISDGQWSATVDSLNNVLFQATVSPEVYEKLSITDYIDDEYFEIEEVSSNASFNNNKIEWKYRDNSFVTGSKDTVKVKLKLKDEYKDVKGLYPTNKKLDIDYKLSGDNKSKTSTDTPILKNNYDVYYDVNLPAECNLEEIESENHFVFDKVIKKDTKLTCPGYVFGGFDIAEKDISLINNDTFMMPEKNIHVRATWKRQSIQKSMDGKINEKTTLYKVVENDALNGTSAKKYVGNHQDSLNEVGDKNIYYYWGNVLKNNLIFANYCWKIIRTTDTGGIKLLYNGAPTSQNTCPYKDTDYPIIGGSMFNLYNSPAYVGYMYNTLYKYAEYNYKPQTAVLQKVAINKAHYFASNYEYNQSVTNKYKLYDNLETSEDDRITAEECISNSNCNEVLTGTYTLSNTNPDYSNATSRYVVGVSGEYIYYLELKNGQPIEEVNSTFYVGDGFIENNDGTFTITSSSGQVDVFSKSSWMNKYTNINNSYVCIGNNPCNNPMYIVSTNTTSYNYEDVSADYVYANDFDYIINTETGNYEYVLKDTNLSNKKKFWDLTTNYDKMNNTHYTCFNDSGKCKEIKYIFYSDSSSLRYITIKDGKNVRNALDEMLISNDVNTTNSEVKTTIDNWYENKMINYTKYLEDTVWCNDRSISSLGGWDPNGGDMSKNLYLNSSNRNQNTLKCINETDSFMVENDKAKLKYPVGMATKNEVDLSLENWNHTNGSLFNSGEYFLLSPDGFIAINGNNWYDGGSASRIYYYTYNLGTSRVNTYYRKNIRPAVSLKPGIEYVDGDGSKNNPYVVDTSEVSVGG